MPTPLLNVELIILAAMAIPIIATAIAEPDRSDAYAVFGAMLAAVAGYFKARSEGKNWMEISSTVLIRSAVGTFAPSVIVFFMPIVMPDSAETFLQKMPWSIFAIFGFIFGHNAEAVIAGLGNLLPGWIQQIFTIRKNTNENQDDSR